MTPSVCNLTRADVAHPGPRAPYSDNPIPGEPEAAHRPAPSPRAHHDTGTDTRRGGTPARPRKKVSAGEHAHRAGKRPVRRTTERGPERTASADQPRLQIPRLHRRCRGRRAGDVRPL